MVFQVGEKSRVTFLQLIKTCDITTRSYFGKMNSTLGSLVPLPMFKSDLSLTMIRRVAIIVWVVAVERRIKKENLWGRERT